MGQPIIVTEKPSVAHPGMVRFETNRALTGMGHEHYRSRGEAVGSRPPDELARRLFDHGGVAGVHVNGNMITVDLAKGGSSEGMAQVVHDLYLFYPGVDGSAAPEAEATVGTGEVHDAADEFPTEPAVRGPRLPNGLAAGSLASGILGVTILPGVGSLIAIVLGLIALRQIKHGRAEGRSMAIGGLLLGLLAVVVAAIVAIVLIAN